MNQVFISVVIPLYNKEKSIQRTIESVLRQSYPFFELIIVNDGSTDQSLANAQKLKDWRIRIINKSNGGVSSARNLGIKESRYGWITFLDGDDVWTSDHLEVLVDLMGRYPKMKFFSTSWTNDYIPENVRQKDYVVEDFFAESFNRALVWSSVVMCNRECFNSVGEFNERLTNGEDIEMWCRIARKYRLVKSEKVTAVYNLDTENRASNKKRILQKCFESCLPFTTTTNRYEILFYSKILAKAILYYARNIQLASVCNLFFLYRCYYTFCAFRLILKRDLHFGK